MTRQPFRDRSKVARPPRAIRRVNGDLWRASIAGARGSALVASGEPATFQRDYLMVNVKQGVLRSTVGTAGGSASTNR